MKMVMIKRRNYVATIKFIVNKNCVNKKNMYLNLYKIV